MYHLVSHLTEKMKGEYLPYNLIFHDFLRVIIMQVVTHILISLSHSGVPLFSGYMFETTMFMIAGLCVYWFCIYVLFPLPLSELKSKTEVISRENNSKINENHDKKIETFNDEEDNDEDVSVLSLESDED
jgi:hypothetical protein